MPPATTKAVPPMSSPAVTWRSVPSDAASETPAIATHPSCSLRGAASTRVG